MKIFVESNFIIPGLENEDRLNFDESELTLKRFFERLSEISSNRLEFIETDSLDINPEDWEIEINGMPYQNYEKGLAHLLKDGDRVGIKILPIGGG